MKHPCDGKGPDLAAYVSGELEPQARAELESHLAGCAVCGELERELRQSWNLLATLPDEEVPDVVIRGIQATIASERVGSFSTLVLVELLLALGMMTMLGIVCPIPIVCQFFKNIVVPLMGARFAFVAHTLAAAAMGVMPLLIADLLMTLMTRMASQARSKRVAAGYAAAVAAGVPLLLFPADPVAISSWVAGCAVAGLASVWLTSRLHALRFS